MAETDTLGSWVRRQRRALDLTQEELARRIGCARITIRKIEAEQLRPSKQMAQLLADHLAVPAAEHESFLRFARGGAPITQAPLRAPRHNLPLQITSFIGRENEVDQVRSLIRKSRLVTLTGSGGTGKTRLALQAVGALLNDFPDGIWLIELAPLSDPTLVPGTIASALGVRDEQGRSLMATMADWLRNRTLLLILDNCEHLLNACAAFADAALHTAPDMRILATSREALRISGETAFRVPSLTCPEPSQARHLTVEALREYPAVHLFIERAAQALPTFGITLANAPAIAEICYRLDGIPLAIELAAARVRSQPVGQIAERLDDRFRLLGDASRTALPRHQTLVSLIDWSHNLLSEPERVLLRRLSVFANGWTVEAAEQVCAGDGLEPADILGLLVHLAEKSLIALDERWEAPRYRMLETIREYARIRLQEAKEADEVATRHLAFFLGLAERTRSMLESAQRAVWLPRLEIEHDNLLVALEWACNHDAEAARWLAGTLERFWFYGDHLHEARTWFTRVLEGSSRAPVTRGLALSVTGLGCVLFNLELMDEARAMMERGVEQWTQLGDSAHLSWSLGWLAYLLLQCGEVARADSIYTEHERFFRENSYALVRVWVLSSWGMAKSATLQDYPGGKALLDEALALAYTLQDPFCFEMCYSSLGDWAMLQGKHAVARAYFLKALEARRQLGTRWIIAAGLWQVASMMRIEGDYVQAEPLYAEALTMARSFGDQRSEAHLSQELGSVAIHLSDAERARTLLASSLLTFRKWADSLGIARSLLGFVDLRFHEGEAGTAARLLGFIRQWLNSNKIQLVHFDRSNYERMVAAAQAELSDALSVDLQEAGAKMTLEETIELALEQTLSHPAPIHPDVAS
ncbi:MAG TPA: tetratricopeptide repeat protein [Anaerolineales bacterium]